MARKRSIQHDAIVATFAQRLRQVRIARGLTQRDLARRADLSESYVSRLESAAIAPGIDLVARLVRALDSSIEELLPLAPPSAEAAQAVAAEQARRLVEAVLESHDPAYVPLLVQLLALLAEVVDRQR